MATNIEITTQHTHAMTRIELLWNTELRIHIYTGERDKEREKGKTRCTVSIQGYI
jgi:hypothetical protein